MRILLSFCLFAALGFSQPTGLRVDGVTATQAILSYVPPSASACTIAVVDASGDTAHDVNGTLFSGADSDEDRATTIFNRRYLIIGTRTSQLADDGKLYSRALRAYWMYTATITCGSGASVSFTTSQINGVAPEAPPASADGFAGLGYPTRDLTTAGRSKPLIDPLTGTASWMVTNPRDQSAIATLSFASGIYFEGASWTNPGNITAAATGTLASTSTADAPIFIPIRSQAANIKGGWSSTYGSDGILTDAGIHLYGYGSDATEANREIGVCLSIDSGQSCYTQQIIIPLPDATADVGTFPDSFPTVGAANVDWEPFVGWGKIIPRDYMATGSVSGNAGTLTFVTANNSAQATGFFNPAWSAGSKIKITNSDPTCADDFCEIASVTSANELETVESYTSPAGPVGTWAIPGGSTGSGYTLFDYILATDGTCNVVYQVSAVDAGAITALAMQKNDTDCNVTSGISTVPAGRVTGATYVSGGTTGWITGEYAIGPTCFGSLPVTLQVTATAGAVTGWTVTFPGDGCLAADEGNFVFTRNTGGATFTASVDVGLATGTGATVNHTAVYSTFEYAGLGFRIVKTTGTGTVNVSASYKLVKSFQVGAGPTNGCSPVAVTTTKDRFGATISPGIQGRLCLFQQFRDGAASLYFVSDDGTESRLLSMGRAPAMPMGYIADDWVNGAVTAGHLPITTSVFDLNDGNIMYAGITTAAGPAIFKITYSGDYSENSGQFFTMGTDGAASTAADDLTWENLTRSDLGNGLADKIAASDSTYDTGLYGSLTGLQFKGITNDRAFFIKLMGGQDSGCWVFAFDTNTGDYVTSWNTVTGGGGAGDRFGGCHAADVSIGRFSISNNGLRRANGELYGGPFAAAPTHVYRSGTPSTTTALPASYDGTYDGACPVDAPAALIARGATGNNCVKVRFATQPCSSYATTDEKAATPCPGDATKSYIGANVAPFDELYDPAVFPPSRPDSEHMVVVKVEAVSGNTFDATLWRNAALGYCSFGLVDSAGVAYQAEHAEDWEGYFVPYGSCGGALQFFDANDPSIVQPEHQLFIRGHMAYSCQPPCSTVNSIGVASPWYLARHNAPFSDVGSYNGLRLVSNIPFNGVALNASITQSYAGPGLGAAGLDWRHINAGSGSEIETPNQTIGEALTFALVSGQTKTWKVTDTAGANSLNPNIKVQPLIIWAGNNYFSDMSSASTGDLITDANEGRFCYAYRANECRTGSSAGDLYVTLTGLETTITTCNASQVARRILCAFPMGPGLTNMVQLDATQSDVTAQRYRAFGTNLNLPGSQYVYSKLLPFSADPDKYFANQYHQNGLWTGVGLVDPGKWSFTSQAAGDYVKIPVQIPAATGSNQARIRFGYVDNGTIGTNFYCTKRAEDCVTDASLAPYAFVGDSLTATTCSSGCTIDIPAIPGRVLAYRIERLNSGSLVATGSLEIRAVQ